MEVALLIVRTTASSLMEGGSKQEQVCTSENG